MRIRAARTDAARVWLRRRRKHCDLEHVDRTIRRDALARAEARGARVLRRGVDYAAQAALIVVKLHTYAED